MDDSQSIHSDFFEVENCLIVPIEFELYDDFLNKLKDSVLEKLKKTSITGIIIDISAINIIDSFNLKSIMKLKKMINLMGKEMVIVGIQPSVAAALTEFQIPELNELLTFMNTKMAIKYFKSGKKI